MYNSRALGRYNCGGYPIPFRGHGFPGRRRTLGDISAPAVALPVLPSALSTFTDGIVSSPWLYVGLGLLGIYAYKTIRAPKRRRRKRGVITPLTAGVYAAGAGAGGYLLGKYSGL
jgi:hypothetical protein